MVPGGTQVGGEDEKVPVGTQVGVRMRRFRGTQVGVRMRRFQGGHK